MVDARWRTLWIGLGLGVAGTLAVQAGLGDAFAAKPRRALDRQQFHEALDLVLDRHVDPVDPRQLLGAGLRHMAGGLDSHSSYLTAEERALAGERERQGADAGIVVELHLDPDVGRVLEVLAVSPGGPAERSGIGPGDHILGVRGRPSVDLVSAAEAQILLAGAAGETIELGLVRAGRSRPETIELELAKPKGSDLVQGRLIQGGTIAAISIRSFRAGVGDQVRSELSELQREAGGRGVAGIVLDLRGNPGGEVDEAIIVADLFVDRGVLTRTRGRGGKILREERATGPGTDTATPLVVLQDRRSASAAELVAVALQDHGRATIVGERSFGKGTVQERIGLADGSLLTLTVARYFSPTDRSIDGVGVEPDVAVVDPSSDAALEVAIWILGGD